MEFVAPQKFIKNTSTNRTNPTELLLNSSSRLQTPKRMKERRKKKKRKEESKKRPAILAGSWSWAEILTLRKTPSQRGNQLGQKRNFRGSKENAADGLWKARQRKNCTHDLYQSSVHSSLNRELPVVKGSCVLERRVLSADPGKGQLLAVKRQPEGLGVRGATTGKFYGKSLRHHSKVSLSSRVQGAEPQS